LTTSPGLSTGPLLDFRLQEDHMRMVIRCYARESERF
jgi:hypothetical protein